MFILGSQIELNLTFPKKDVNMNYLTKRLLLLNVFLIISIGYSQSITTNFSQNSILNSNLENENTTLMGRWAHGACKAAAVDDDKHIAYIGNGISFEALDITTPADIKVLSKTLLPYKIYDIFITANYAYVATNLDGLRIIDISNPEDIKEVGFYDPDHGNTLGIYVNGHFAYLANGYGDLQKIDVSNPSNPSLQAEISINGYCNDVFVNGNYAYVTADKGFAVINISGTDSLVEVSYTNVKSSGIYVKNDLAYIATHYSSLKIMDVSDPAKPFPKSTVSLNDNANSVKVSGDYAYAAIGDSGFAVIDISDPNAPLLTAALATNDYASDVVIKGTCAYVADRSAGLKLIDISTPSEPNICGHFETGDESSFAYNVTVKGDIAYLANGDDGLCILDISNVNTPQEITTYKTGSTNSVFVEGNYAYAATSYSGLHILDISDPANPIEETSYQTGSYIKDVFVKGDYAYIAAKDSLHIVDISNPQNPVLKSIYATENNKNIGDIYVVGDYAYITNSAFTIIDVSDPENPTKTGSYNTSNCRSVYVQGNYAYVTENHTGVYVIDISDPSSPSKSGLLFITSEELFGIHVQGDYAYVANSYDGLLLVNISDPENPVEAGSYDTHDKALGLFFDRNYAYVADNYAGLAIIRNDLLTSIEEQSKKITPKEFSLSQNYPNPFNPVTTIKYEVPSNSKVNITIYDINGRKIMTLLDQKQNSGKYSLTFNAEELASGIYIYKLQAASIVKSRKMILLK
jgi:hypothetical protein